MSRAKVQIEPQVLAEAQKIVAELLSAYPLYPELLI